jgi:hypothetical protein
MAAQVTNHIWTVREWLLCLVVGGAGIIAGHYPLHNAAQGQRPQVRDYKDVFLIASLVPELG